MMLLPLAFAMTPTWDALASKLPSVSQPHPPVLDTVLESSDRPPKEGLTLFRERHGWCPYSEKVWLALELKGLDFNTVLIDNTGGGRPSWYGGQTPQVTWPDGKKQGESMDIVKALDARYPNSRPLWPPAGASASDVSEMVSAFRRAFPSNARPSSRAAFLFSYDGPLPRSTFEKALDATEALLATHSGPFFVGDELSAADVSWAPFLERYAAQLPCLHDGLLPRDASRWPRLAEWYDAMDSVPEYACRVKGDGESWARVLTMQGYGNAGSVPGTTDFIAEAAAGDAAGLWSSFEGSRPHVAASAAEEAAARIVGNFPALVADATARKVGASGSASADPFSADECDAGLRAVASALMEGDGALDDEARGLAAALVSYLVGRMCVPRDMGVPAALALRRMATSLGGEDESDGGNSSIRKYD